MKIKMLSAILISTFIFMSCSSSEEARKEAEEKFGPIQTILFLPYVSPAGENMSDINPRAKDYLFKDRMELMKKFTEKGYRVVDYEDVEKNFEKTGSLMGLFSSDPAMKIAKNMNIDAVLQTNIANYRPPLKSAKEKKRAQIQSFPFNYRFGFKMKHTGTLGIVFSTNFIRSYDNSGLARTPNGGYASSLSEYFINKGF